MRDDHTLDLNKERELQKQIANLAVEEDPAIDLWPEIKSQIVAPEIQYRAPKWMSWAIAASLIVSFGSVTFSWQNLQQAKVAYEQFESVPRSQAESYLSQVQLMEDAYQVTKAILLKNIAGSGSNIDKLLMSDIEARLVDIELAASSIKEAIKKQPDNIQLPLLLKTTYQQELQILTQISKLTELDSSVKLDRFDSSI